MSDPLSDDTWASQERPLVSPHTSLVSTPASESRSKEEEIGGKEVSGRRNRRKNPNVRS